jgi:hypothetical protein
MIKYRVIASGAVLFPCKTKSGKSEIPLQEQKGIGVFPKDIIDSNKFSFEDVEINKKPYKKVIKPVFLQPGDEFEYLDSELSKNKSTFEVIAGLKEIEDIPEEEEDATPLSEDLKPVKQGKKTVYKRNG